MAARSTWTPPGKTSRESGTAAAGWSRLSTARESKQSRLVETRKWLKILTADFHGSSAMKERFLSSGIVVVAFVLAAALILPNRSISGFMQACGQFIADLFGF